MIPSPASLALGTFSALTLAGLPAAQSEAPLGTNLLTNPSFESDLIGWTKVASAPIVVTYGSLDVPTLAVGTHIGGGGRLLTDGGSQSAVEQVVFLGTVAPGTHLRAGGYFGGVNEDGARLVVRFLDAGGAEIQRENLDYVLNTHRNFETVLMLRERQMGIPPGTVSIAALVELYDTGCCFSRGSADAIFIELNLDPLEPPPVPLFSELLNNPGFESGWAPGSPLTLTDPRGWEGAGPGPVLVKPYSDVDPKVPDTLVSCLIGGGTPSTSCVPGGAGRLLADQSNGTLRQRIDVRGNAAAIASGAGLVLRLSSFLGGVDVYDDTARIDVRFLDATGATLAALPPVGPVSKTARNSETVLLKRERLYPVHEATSYIEIDAAFTDTGCCTPNALLDNVTAALELPAAPEPIALQTNVISNGGFESGSLPGSPLELTNPDGWSGFGPGIAEVLAYGQDANVPPVSFAASSGLGGLLLGDAGAGAALRQDVDLTADQELVDAGRLRAFGSAWLGGVGSYDDRAELRVRFLNSSGVQVGGPGGLHVLGPVTAAERGNQTTLLERSEDFAVPPGAATMQVEVIFTDVGCCTAYALADGVSVVVYDVITGGPVVYPGSGEDFHLLTGINGEATTGPGMDVKPATALDVLRLELESPGGTFDFVPLLIAFDAFATGSAPPTVVPGFPAGLVLNLSTLTIIVDGLGCGGFACDLVLPGGTLYTYAIPPGLGGLSVLLQGVAYPKPGSGLVPLNGFFAASEGHEIQIH